MQPSRPSCLGEIRLLFVAIFTAAVLAASPAFAVEPDEILDDPKLEQRARDISLELRCLVCQNQSIDDSSAPLARDLRLLVRERLQKGESNAEVLDFVVSRYGEFVLLKPPFGWHTMLLWLTPALVLAGGIWLGRSVLYKSDASRAVADSAGSQPPLTVEEQERLQRILEPDKNA